MKKIMSKLLIVAVTTLGMNNYTSSMEDTKSLLQLREEGTNWYKWDKEMRDKLDKMDGMYIWPKLNINTTRRIGTREEVEGILKEFLEDTKKKYLDEYKKYNKAEIENGKIRKLMHTRGNDSMDFVQPYYPLTNKEKEFVDKSSLPEGSLNDLKNHKLSKEQLNYIETNRLNFVKKQYRSSFRMPYRNPMKANMNIDVLTSWVVDQYNRRGDDPLGVCRHRCAKLYSKLYEKGLVSAMVFCRIKTPGSEGVKTLNHVVCIIPVKDKNGEIENIVSDPMAVADSLEDFMNDKNHKDAKIIDELQTETGEGGELLSKYLDEFYRKSLGVNMNRGLITFLEIPLDKWQNWEIVDKDHLVVLGLNPSTELYTVDGINGHKDLFSKGGEKRNPYSLNRYLSEINKLGVNGLMRVRSNSIG